MKQQEDNKTAELDLVAKRGRGRPAKPDAMTPAERAKKYRDAHRNEKKIPVTPSIVTDKAAHINGLMDAHLLREELRAAKQEIERLNERHEKMKAWAYEERPELITKIRGLEIERDELTKQVNIVLARERKLTKEVATLKKLASQK